MRKPIVLHFAGKVSKMGQKLIIIIPKKLHDDVKRLGEYVEVLLTRYGEGPRPPPRLKEENGKVICYYPSTQFDEEEEPLVLNTGVNIPDLLHFSENPVETIRILLLFARQALEEGDMEKGKKLINNAMKLLAICF